MPTSEEIRDAVISMRTVSETWEEAENVVAAVHELTEALEDAITGCSNPRQAPGEVLAKYNGALDE